MNVPEIIVGSGRQRGALTLFTLFSRVVDDPPPPRRLFARPEPTRYVLSEEAMAAGALKLREIDEAGRVNVVRAENKGRSPVLLLEGQHLVGAKQNRVVNGSILIGGGKNLDVPVSCVEQGRWAGARGDAFRAADQGAPLGVRRVLKVAVTSASIGHLGHRSNQGEIWEEIANVQRARNVVSPTAALGDSFMAQASSISSCVEGLGWSEGATGLAAAVAGRLVQIDLFDRPDTCARYWKRLSEAIAFDALENKRAGTKPSVGVVYDALESLAGASWQAVTPVGEGQEQRVQDAGGFVASMLALGERIVHLSAIAVQ